MSWPSNDDQRPETERLFGPDSVPSVLPAVSTGPAAARQQQQQQHVHQQLHQQQQSQQQHVLLAPAAPPPQQQQQQQQQPAVTALEGGTWVENTLDESVWATLTRDVATIGRNLRSVLLPVNWDFGNHSAALTNWDLWGPLIFMLGLAITLSIGERRPSDVFALVFTEVALGACVLTLNVVLLGGNIVFFQSLCLIGYCLAPIVLAAGICTAVKLAWARTLVLLVCLGWASWATVPFIGKTVSQERRALAVYPVLLMYVSIGWLALVKS